MVALYAPGCVLLLCLDNLHSLQLMINNKLLIINKLLKITLFDKSIRRWRMETQFQSDKVLDNQSFQQLQTTFCHRIPTKMNFKKKILIIRALYLHLPPKHIQWLSQISRPFHKLEISNISSQNTLI